MCTKEEVKIQHFAIAKKLDNVSDELFREIYDGNEEMNACKEALDLDGFTAKELRTAARERHFEVWTSMSYAGNGVHHFKTHTKSNRFVSDKTGLSGPEWVAALKLSFNYANLAGVPGSSQASSNLCRRCFREKETIAHVLGTCPFGLNRRSARHHAVKHAIAELLRSKGFYTVDEAPCIDELGSRRFFDILAFDGNSRRAYIIDPTVRYKTNADVDQAVREEKRQIYQGCIPDLKQKYTQFGEREYKVLGMWFGARGGVGESALELFENLDLPKDRISDITTRIISDSIRIIHQHIYA